MRQSEAVLACGLVSEFAPRRAGVYRAELLWGLETDGRVWDVEIGREERTGMRGMFGLRAEATTHDDGPGNESDSGGEERGCLVCGLEVWRFAVGMMRMGELLGGWSVPEIVNAGRALSSSMVWRWCVGGH